MRFLTTAELEAELEYVKASPKDEGELTLIVRRPRQNEREELEIGELDVEKGLVGDRWCPADGADAQITIMNSRIASLLARSDDRIALAGDQLYVDIDLTEDNIPHGTRLALGDAVLETTSVPHNGCKKFVERFGLDGMKFVNSPLGKKFHLRGIYAKVVKSGKVTKGDKLKKL